MLGDRGRRSIERPAAVVERRAGQAGDRRVRRGGDHRRRRRLRAARGPHRHLRSGRHALGRAPALHPGDVRARPGGRACRRASGVEDRGAVQGGAHGRPRGDGQVHRGRLGGDHRRHPCRDDQRGVPGDRRGRGSPRRRIRASSGCTPSWSISRCSRSWSYLRANGFRTYIVTGGGQEFVRVYSEAGLRRAGRAGGRLEHRHQVRVPGRQAGADARAQGVLHRRQAPARRSASTCSSASGRTPRSATRAAIARCWNGPAPATARAS